MERKMIILCDLYRYCEQPVLAPLEKVIEKAAGSLDKMIEVLKNPKLSKELNFNASEEKTLKRLIQIGHLKFHIHNEFGPWIEAIYKIEKIISNKYKIPLEKALMMNNAEIKAALKGKIPSVILLKERLGGCVLLPSAKDKKWQCFTGKRFKDWKEILEPEGAKTITGTVTYPGKAKGPVKLHLSLIRGGKIPKGMVVVSGMTNPQIVPFLKDAVAIVTDEGGLTCHAAIVSRELKIPCIVGTQIATKVLKDGDLVEVDANRGIVKIIKKA
jgi:phosphohistidine swiveling domain-containing protein